MKAMTKLLSTAFAFLLLGNFGFTQNQHMNWHFGSGVGLNFSSGNPVPFSGSMIDTQESCYTVSDDGGNILFYTNGLTIWDASNTPMSNGSGLLGNISAQCMVIPRPEHPGVYYVVTTDAATIFIQNGITYSEVDMSLNGGMGDVTATKNAMLTANGSEWITAVPHANCVDTWILCHGYGNNSVLMAFLVTEAGISTTPVTTDIGLDVASAIEGIGLMKPNPVTNQVVMTAPYVDGKVLLFELDKSTGEAMNTEVLFPGTPSNLGYGIEFSRSGNRLYTSEFMFGKVFQYDMTASDISASRTEIADLSVPGEAGQLQIAPNDKIYVNYNVFPAGANFIGAINNPEGLGAACNFVQNAVSFTGSTINGLPWYYFPQLNNEVEPDLGADRLMCASDEVILDPFTSDPSAGTILWSDGSIGQTFAASESGTYWVEYQLGECEVKRDTVVIQVDTTQVNNPLLDTMGCAPLQVQAIAENGVGLENWVWNVSNGDEVTAETFDYTFTSGGTYTVSLSAETVNHCIVESDATTVDVLFSPVANFTFNPPMYSFGDEIQFFDQSTGEVVSWQWVYNSEVISTEPEASVVSEIYNNVEMQLAVFALNGCSDTIVKMVPINSGDLVYVPNTFTPNADGINDTFFPVDVMGIVSEMSVYNRWGELVWSRSSATDSWDGKYNGEWVPNGTYIWYLMTTVDEINREEIVGHVNVMR